MNLHKRLNNFVYKSEFEKNYIINTFNLCVYKSWIWLMNWVNKHSWTNYFGLISYKSDKLTISCFGLINYKSMYKYRTRDLRFYKSC